MDKARTRSGAYTGRWHRGHPAHNKQLTNLYWCKNPFRFGTDGCRCGLSCAHPAACHNPSDALVGRCTGHCSDAPFEPGDTVEGIYSQAGPSPSAPRRAPPGERIAPGHLCARSGDISARVRSPNRDGLFPESPHARRRNERRGPHVLCRTMHAARRNP